jgi:hypothetical protein
MKKLLGMGLIATLLLFIGCGDNNSTSSSKNGNQNRVANNQDINQTKDCNNSVDINGTPKSNLTQELKDAIAYMGNEERLAYDVYHNLYRYHLQNSNIEIRQLKNISENSEVQHVGIVQDIVRKYSIEPDELTIVEEPVANRDIDFKDMPSGKYGVVHIQELYNMLYAKGIESQIDALEVGCMVEVTDVNDLDEYIALAKESNASDILDAFEFLRNGSYNHYWAFDNGLKSLGIANGCCSLGVIDGVNYCRLDFPNNENSQGGGEDRQAQGHGNGRNH